MATVKTCLVAACCGLVLLGTVSVHAEISSNGVRFNRLSAKEVQSEGIHLNGLSLFTVDGTQYTEVIFTYLRPSHHE